MRMNEFTIGEATSLPSPKPFRPWAGEDVPPRVPIVSPKPVAAPWTPTPPLADLGSPGEREAPTADRLSPDHTDALLSRMSDALDAGASVEHIGSVVCSAVQETPALRSYFSDLAIHVDQQSDSRAALTDHASRELAGHLRSCPAPDPAAVDHAITTLQELADRPQPGSLGVSTDPTTGRVALFWGADTPTDQESDRGSVLLVAVTGGQVGDHTTQHNIITHVVDDPVLDFATLMHDPEISQALAAVAHDPDDPDTRAAAVHVLNAGHADATDWTTAYARETSARTQPSWNLLGGTVLIVRSRGVQVGDRTRQVNEVVYSNSPTINAAAMLTHPEVVNTLIDVVTRPGDRAARIAFDNAFSAGLRSDLAQSGAARRGYGTVHRPPDAGRTLRIENATGVAVGNHVSSKTDFAQAAQLGRRAQRGVRKAGRAVRQVARRAPG